jgi:hypothetical protein
MQGIFVTYGYGGGKTFVFLPVMASLWQTKKEWADQSLFFKTMFYFYNNNVPFFLTD